MAYAIAVIAIQVMTVLHVIRSGRTQPWLFVVMFLPLVGSAIYLIAEVLPEVMGQQKTQRALSSAKDKLDPERLLRDLEETAQAVGTPQAHANVARELVRLGRFGDAANRFRSIMSGVFADDAELAFAETSAAFEAAECGQFSWDQARAAFDGLDKLDSKFRARDRMLFRARLAAADGNIAAADAAFRDLTTGHAPPEVRVRFAHFLFNQGRLDEARALLDSVIGEARRSTPHVRSMNAFWFGQAETALAIVTAAQAKA